MNKEGGIKQSFNLLFEGLKCVVSEWRMKQSFNLLFEGFEVGSE